MRWKGVLALIIASPVAMAIGGVAGAQSSGVPTGMSNVATKGDMLQAIIFSPDDPEIVLAGPYLYGEARKLASEKYPPGSRLILFVEGTREYEAALDILLNEEHKSD